MAVWHRCRIGPEGFAASTALLYASTSESPLEIERYRRLAKALGVNGLIERNEDLIQLADAMRAARRASSDIPVRASKYVASDPRMPSTRRCWCLKHGADLGTGWLIRCSHFELGFVLCQRFFPLAWNWNLTVTQARHGFAVASGQIPQF